MYQSTLLISSPVKQQQQQQNKKLILLILTFFYHVSFMYFPQPLLLFVKHPIIWIINEVTMRIRTKKSSSY